MSGDRWKWTREISLVRRFCRKRIRRNNQRWRNWMLRGQPLIISSGRRRFKIFLIRSLHGKTKIRRETNRRPGRWHDQVIVLHVRHSCSLEFTCGEGASFVTLKAHALMDFLSNFLVKMRGKSEELVSFMFVQLDDSARSYGSHTVKMAHNRNCFSPFPIE